MATELFKMNSTLTIKTKKNHKDIAEIYMNIVDHIVKRLIAKVSMIIQNKREMAEIAWNEDSNTELV
jgi:hypothetical protein